jgi:hypothetical protein
VKVTLFAVVPPAVVTVTVRLVLDAEFAITKEASMVVPSAETEVTVAVTPAPALMVAPEMKFVPVNVTPTVVLWVPEVGLILLNVGRAGRVTVNVTALVVPFTVVTVTFRPLTVALPAMVNVAVMVVPSADETTLLAVTPEPEMLSVPPCRLVPLSVTLTEVPCTPEFGVIDLRTGVGTEISTAPMSYPLPDGLGFPKKSVLGAVTGIKATLAAPELMAEEPLVIA